MHPPLSYQACLQHHMTGIDTLPLIRLSIHAIVKNNLFPRIISVDMLDTGVDVREAVNLVPDKEITFDVDVQSVVSVGGSVGGSAGGTEGVDSAGSSSSCSSATSPRRFLAVGRIRLASSSKPASR